jgi:extracellular elastinolytic metalloproteinase
MLTHLWDRTSPRRDGSLENGVIIHEYAHGLSSRLIGGPANPYCLLGDNEPLALGEGWGDFLSVLIRMRPHFTHDQVFEMGRYVNTKGFRPFPYATSLTTNPQTYKDINVPKYKNNNHDIGSVWANILYNVYWTVVDTVGFNSDLFSIKSFKHDRYAKLGGNVVMLKLVVEGMKMMSCNKPSFINARDAIIKADEALFDGEHICLLWTGFAKRGLGIDAKEGGINGLNVPTECQ